MNDHTPIPYFPKNLEDYAPWVATHGLRAPYGKCQCGCGNDASIATMTERKFGRIKGQPVRFVRGHHLLRGNKIAQKYETLLDAFNAQVDRDMEGGCWIARSIKNKRAGYGRIHFRDKAHLAHRTAWLLFRGPIPNGLLVCHKCDNPPCCNPDHLFLGTPQDNMNDKMAKGRYRNGRLTHGRYAGKSGKNRP